MKRTVFISHSSEDKAIGEEVCRFLEENGVLCWIAPRDVTPGKNYGAAIVDAIDECDVFVLILTHESNKSGQVAREVERAASNNDIIIPFRVEPVEPSRNLEFYVSASHWLDATEKPLANHLPALLHAIPNWQSRERAREREKLSTVAAPPLPAQRPYVWLAMVAGGITLGVVLFGFALYQAYRHTISGKDQEEPAVSVTQETPSIFSPSPTASIASLSTTPATSLAVPAIFTSPTPAAPSAQTASPTTSPLRRRPGESLRSPVPEAAFSPSVASSPMTLRPGQPLAPAGGSTTASPSPVPTLSDKTKASQSPVPTSAPAIREVAASSQLNAEEPTYRPTLAFDGNRSTAWVTNNDGVGQSISVHFKAPAAISAVSILNSVATNETEYQRSNRVHTVRMTLSDGTSQLLTFEDKLKSQRFELQMPAVADWVKFDIVSVFRGKKNDHTVISEIAFNRDVSNAVIESARPRPPESRQRRSPTPKPRY